MKNDLRHIEQSKEKGSEERESSKGNKTGLNNVDDHHLWRMFRNGKEEALIFIYRNFVNVLYNYGCQFTGERELIKDTVQEFFIELLRNRKNLGDTSSIKFYLFRSFRRKLARALKKENKIVKEKLPDGDHGFQIGYDPEIRFLNDQMDEQQRHLLQTKFGCLPPKQREALLLYYYEGLSYEQIAALFEMGKVKSARVLIYRAIDKLTKEFKVRTSNL